MSYSKYALYGVIAGLLTGIVMSAVLITFLPSISELIDDLVIHQLSSLPPDELSKINVEDVLGNVRRVVNSLIPITPLIQVIQYCVLGSLFGVLQGFITLRFKVRDSISAIISGTSFMLLINVLPLTAAYALMPGLINLIASSLGITNFYLIAMLPGITYTSSLLLTSLVKGPWIKFVESSPKYT